MIMMNIAIMWLALLDWGYRSYSMLPEKKIFFQMLYPIQWVYFFRYRFHYVVISQVIALEIYGIWNYKNCLPFFETKQKTNIIRDYLEDINEIPKSRMFWPRQIWSKYVNKLEVHNFLPLKLTHCQMSIWLDKCDLDVMFSGLEVRRKLS